MMHAVDRVALAAQQEARIEQRRVVTLAVVGDQHFVVGEKVGERVQHRGLFVVVAHEEHPHAETVGLDGSDADQEGAGAGSAGEAGRLRVEKCPAAGVAGGDLAF